MYISEEQFASSIRFAEGLAEVAAPADFAPYVLSSMARLVGCDMVTYNQVLPGAVEFLDYPQGSLDPRTNAVFAALVHEHPVIGHFLATGDRSPRAISDFLPQSTFHQLALYQEFFRPIPVEYQLALTVTGRGPGLIGIALCRSSRDFSDSERTLVRLLGEPLRHSFDRLAGIPAPAAGGGGATGPQSTASPPANTRPSTLTPRESLVLALVAGGGTNAAISRRLGCSERTVAKHLEHLYRKLDVASRAEAAAWFVRGPAL